MPLCRATIFLRARRHSSQALVALLLFTLVGCDFGPPPVMPSPTSPVQPARTATFPAATSPSVDAPPVTIRLSQDVISLNPWLAQRDPASQAVAHALFSGLTKLDDHLQPQPDLAERWDVSEDGTQITFHLRPSLVWHDGAPLTAEDVVWSYRTLLHLTAENTPLVHIQDSVSGVEAVDPITSTIRFTLKRRFSPLLADLSMPVLPSHILSGTTVDKLPSSTFNDAPVGSGPFKFSRRIAGQSVSLVSNSGYYGGAPGSSRLAFVVAPNNEVAAKAVKDGTLLLAQLPPFAAESVVRDAPGARGGSFNELGYDYIAFNLRPPHPFSDTRLRQAWALALDKPGLTFKATGGGADPVVSDVNKASWAYDPAVTELVGKPEEAVRLLAEAGWTQKNKEGILVKDKKPLEITLLVRSDNEVRRKAATEMVEPLRHVGIKLVVQPADFNTAILARLSPSARPAFDFDAVMLGWSRAGVDPDSFALFHSSQIPTEAQPNLLNFTGFAAPEYDTLSIEARSTYDFARRKEIYSRLQNILADQLPYYFLWAEKFGIVAGPKLNGDINFGSPNYLWNIESWSASP